MCELGFVRRGIVTTTQIHNNTTNNNNNHHHQHQLRILFAVLHTFAFARFVSALCICIILLHLHAFVMLDLSDVSGVKATVVVF